MTDPFKIVGPTMVANSAGKTSGFNLWKHLQANGGTLTDTGRAVFTNTGWEDRRSLDFLAEQERRWAVDIVMLEFCWRPATEGELATYEAKWQRAQDRLARFRAEPASFFAPRRRRAGGPAVLFDTDDGISRKADAVRKAEKHATDCYETWRKAGLIGMPSQRRVTRDTASTDGRPFEELLQGLLRFREEVKGKPGVLPNAVQRICTGDLKAKPMARFAFEAWGVGRSGFRVALGLRADEQDRIASALDRGVDGGVPYFPLDDAGVTKADVAAFWADQPFGVGLKAHEGNCGGCHMKRRGALLDLIRREFFDVSWWARWERRTGQRFRLERSYRGLMAAAASEQTIWDGDDLDNGITCETGYCSN